MTLSEYRARRKLTQAEFAVLLGSTQATVQRWEAGIHMPRRRDMARIVDVTEGLVTPNDFHEVAADRGAAHAA